MIERDSDPMIELWPRDDFPDVHGLVRRWVQAGRSKEDAAIWIARGFDEPAWGHAWWLEAGIDEAAALAWYVSGSESPEAALSWVRAGLSPDAAEAWAATGAAPAEAKRLAGLGWVPETFPASFFDDTPVVADTPLAAVPPESQEALAPYLEVVARHPPRKYSPKELIEGGYLAHLEGFDPLDMDEAHLSLAVHALRGSKTKAVDAFVNLDEVVAIALEWQRLGLSADDVDGLYDAEDVLGPATYSAFAALGFKASDVCAHCVKVIDAGTVSDLPDDKASAWEAHGIEGFPCGWISNEFDAETAERWTRAGMYEESDERAHHLWPARMRCPHAVRWFMNDGEHFDSSDEEEWWLKRFAHRIEAAGQATSDLVAQTSSSQQPPKWRYRSGQVPSLWQWYDAYACEHPADVADTVVAFVATRGRAPAPGEIPWSEVPARDVSDDDDDPAEADDDDDEPSHVGS